MSVDPEDALIERIRENLEKNGFPAQKVSFPKEKLEAIAAEGEVELDMALSRLSMSSIYSVERAGKIVFAASAEELEESAPSVSPASNPLGDLPFDIDPSLFAGKSPEDMKSSIDDFMSSMSDEQRNKMMEQFMNMPADERDKLMNQAKDMGIS